MDLKMTKQPILLKTASDLILVRFLRILFML